MLPRSDQKIRPKRISALTEEQRLRLAAQTHEFWARLAKFQDAQAELRATFAAFRALPPNNLATSPDTVPGEFREDETARFGRVPAAEIVENSSESVENTPKIIENGRGNAVARDDLFLIVPYPPPFPEQAKFTFIDLFAGIGGFRLAMQSLGGRCVFSSEWDAKAQDTYFCNFGEIPFGDITSDAVKSRIPAHFDVLCAGFPCQAFSIAGRRAGFEDTRGTLFFDTAQIIERHQPKAFFLENVKNLLHHDRGNTFRTILRVLRDDLHYVVPEPQLVNALNFGVPQHRERVYIVGFRQDLGIKASDFSYPKPLPQKTHFIDIREKNVVPAKYYISTQYLKTLRAHRARHEAKGHGFGYEIIDDNGVANALVVGGMGRERNLVIDKRLQDFTPQTHIKGDINREGIRRMTPREWARLQGFPDDFRICVADASAYKQFGNSVAVPAIRATAAQLLKTLKIL